MGLTVSLAVKRHGNHGSYKGKHLFGLTYDSVVMLRGMAAFMWT